MMELLLEEMLGNYTPSKLSKWMGAVAGNTVRSLYLADKECQKNIWAVLPLAHEPLSISKI